MEYGAFILGLFVFAVLILIFHKKIEQVAYKYRFINRSLEYVYAHELIMETGEILSRPPSERYPDMETNQAKIKQYYQRVNSAPINIKHAEIVKHENVKPILQRVK